MLTWPSKFPGEVVVNGFDWTKSLDDGDTVVDTDIAVPAGFTVDQQSHQGALQSVKLRGGLPGVRYILLTAITERETLQEIVRVTVKHPEPVTASAAAAPAC